MMNILSQYKTRKEDDSLYFRPVTEVACQRTAECVGTNYVHCQTHDITSCHSGSV